jgi:hypothetical protein
MPPVFCLARPETTVAAGRNGMGPPAGAAGREERALGAGSLHSGVIRTLTAADEEQLPTVSPTRTRTREPDQACAQAVDVARAAAEEIAAAGQVGDHVGVQADGDRLVTHLFACTDLAYEGWQWAITVARASRAKNVTVSEAVLLPGSGALLAPDWVPWSERVRPGDLGVGDLMPVGQDDERLVPAVSLAGDDGLLDWDDSADWADGLDLLALMTWPGGPVAVPGADPAEPADPAGPVASADLADPAGSADAAGSAGPEGSTDPDGSGEPPDTGRARVLSAIGRDLTADRWYTGEHGPSTALANAAPAPCLNCGFLIRLGGPLGRAFGVCANEYAPDDGRVVSLDHGCGAHSEATAPAGPFAGTGMAPGDPDHDLVDATGVSLADTVFESLD